MNVDRRRDRYDRERGKRGSEVDREARVRDGRGIKERGRHAERWGERTTG